MLDPVLTAAPPQQAAPDPARKVLHWRRNERMGGMVPVWETGAADAKTKIADRLAQAENGGKSESFAAALAYAQPDMAANPYENAQEFGFGDLIDMANPLHHLPVVGYLYRELTGDDIRPIAKIIGGGIYGGVAGAAAGLVDTAIEYETGRSLTGNVVALVTEGDAPAYRSIAQGGPEQRLNAAAAYNGEKPRNLPNAVIGFADTGGQKSRFVAQYKFND